MKVKKVRSEEDGLFMGCDWVLNSQGQGATLSFCFLNPEGTECFGLTVGHLTDTVDKSILKADPFLCRIISTRKSAPCSRLGL
mmetsp:Transcript_22827/g.33711  ORF Transcript_22827/g.33711 Transcript_22827/m.33711 type:complete len:83 (+) Transcript_22827:474-722(+)